MQEVLSWYNLTCIRGQPVAAISLHHRGFRGLNSGHQTCKQPPPLTEPSHHRGVLLKTNNGPGLYHGVFPRCFPLNIVWYSIVCIYHILFSIYILKVILVATKSWQSETSVQRFLYLYKFLAHLGKNRIQLLGHTPNIYLVWQEIKKEKGKEREKGWKEGDKVTMPFCILSTMTECLCCPISSH